MRLYIDPGTGSMLFTLLIGVIGAAIYSIRMLFLKFRYKVSGGKVEQADGKVPFAIYSDDKRYWNIFEPVCKEMERRGIDVLYLTGSEDDPALTCGYSNVKAECIGKGNASFTKLNYMKANVLLSTTPGLDVYQWKRSKDVDCYVHMLHAAGEIVLYRMFGVDYYDCLLLSGQHQVNNTRELEEMRNLPAKEIELIGIPYMDVMAERLANAEPLPPHERTVLLAPSWGPRSIFNVYGEKVFDALLKTGYHIIVRPHPQSYTSEKELIDRLMAKYPANEQLEWNSDRDNFNVLRSADIMISDFSGAIFDFSFVYDKPIVYTDPNQNVDIYDAWWIKTPRWTLSAFPRLGCQLTDEHLEDFKSLIDTLIDDPKYTESRRQVISEAWPHQGEGASRVVDFLVKKYDEIKAAEAEKAASAAEKSAKKEKKPAKGENK